jgi:hypothetical protein
MATDCRCQHGKAEHSGADQACAAQDSQYWFKKADRKPCPCQRYRRSYLSMLAALLS